MRRLYLATLLVSAAAVGYEILLMRVLSIVQWHHFAWMVISLALLGYGASGTFIALARRWLEPRFDIAFASAALLFSVSMVACFALGQRVPFNALEIVWDNSQLLYLAVLYLVFFVPFFFAACCIGLALTCRSEAIHRIYFSDLAGAGCGAILIVAVLFAVFPQNALVVLVALALSASYLVAAASRARVSLGIAQITWLLALAAIVTGGGLTLRVSEFKGLSQALQVVDSRVVAQSSSPLGLLAVVDSPTVPVRHAPGLSFATRHIPPEQLAVFTDADGMSAITRYDGDPGSVAHLRDMTGALPYALLDEPDVLVLGAGGGSDVLTALVHNANRIDAVELDPDMSALIADKFAAYAGHLYQDPRVTLYTGEARGFVARNNRNYDLIQIGLLDSFAASGAGVQALNENYIYTVDAVRAYLSDLRPGGLLAITRWIKSPPRDSLKLAAIAIEALRQSGVDDPGRRLAVIRSWNTVTMIVKNGDLSPGEVTAIREFARSRSFDTAWFPGIEPRDTNRYNLLDRAWVHDGIVALLGSGADEFRDAYKFRIDPATDDRPYFFHFFEWRTLPEVLSLRKAGGGAGLIEWAYLILVATLVQAIVAGIVLILVPLTRIERTWSDGPRMGAYFFLLGLAFLFIEIAFIQKFILFLSHPLYSIAVVLAGFLVFAGAGSALSTRLAERVAPSGRSPVTLAVAGIALFALVYIVALPPVFAKLAGLPDVAKIGLSVTLIAPLAFLMGMPFPLGLRRVADRAPDFVPWAWGINGFASVVSAVLAALLAIQFGFTTVVGVAVVLYAAAAALKIA